MPRARKLDQDTTMRKIFWKDIDKIVRYKEPIKRYVNQKKEQFESDAQLFHRVVSYYIKHHPNPPNKHTVSTFPGHCD